MANGMRDRGRKTFDRTNQELADKEAAVLLRTTIDWEALRPQIADDGAPWDKLVAAVNEATQNNNDLALLKQRLTALGTEGMDLVQKVVRLI